MPRPKPAPFDTTNGFRRQNEGKLLEATCSACKVSYVWTGKPAMNHARCPTCNKPIRGAGRAAWHRTGWVLAAPLDETALPPPEPKPKPVVKLVPKPQPSPPIPVSPDPATAPPAESKKKRDTDLVLKEPQPDSPSTPAPSSPSRKPKTSETKQDD